MNALPEPHDNEKKNNQLPVTPGLIGKIQGTQPTGINSDQLRELKRLLNGYTGGILIEAVNGHVVKDGIHRIKMTTYSD